MDRDLDDLSPLVRSQVDAWLAANAAAGDDVLVTCTKRSAEDQAALWARGRDANGVVVDRKAVVTDAKPWQSAHQYGMAVDFAPLVNGKLDWNGSDPIWDRVGARAVACGLEWAGTPGFPFPEQPHVQLPNWRQHIAKEPA